MNELSFLKIKILIAFLCDKSNSRRKVTLIGLVSERLNIHSQKVLASIRILWRATVWLKTV